MDDEKKVFSFSNEELREAEELNARADTRMTEEYKRFLEEHFGGEGELYHEHIDESNEYVDRSAADNEGEFCEEYTDASNEYVDQSAADNGGEFCEEYTDANESGEYSEDGLTRSFDDGYVSNRYEPSTSGTFVMDSDSAEDRDGIDPVYEK